MINLIIGSNSLIGRSICEEIKRKKLKNYYLISKSNSKKKNHIKLNLNNNLNKIKYNKINKCFFLSSPRYEKKNFKKKIYNQEYIWIKKIINTLSIKKLIYLSSSTIYQKKHFIGDNKIKIENLLTNKNKKVKYVQIWRPFNLVGSNQYKISDHFHNKLFKIIFLERKKNYLFNGNGNDQRGYSLVDDFTKICLQSSKQDKNFVKNYGNPNVISIHDMIKIYNKKCKKYLGYSFHPKFKSIKSNHNSVKNFNFKNTFFSKKKSSKIIETFLDQMLINFQIKTKKVFR